MRTWPQSSQASTWPPRAAVRQCLDRRHHLELAEAQMAGMGARARRVHDARKMSATSSDGRITAPPHAARLRSRPADRLSRSSGLMTVRIVRGGDPGVERGGLELGVAEQDLDDANVDVLSPADAWRSCGAACAASPAW